MGLFNVSRNAIVGFQKLDSRRYIYKVHYRYQSEGIHIYIHVHFAIMWSILHL